MIETTCIVCKRLNKECTCPPASDSEAIAPSSPRPERRRQADRREHTSLDAFRHLYIINGDEYVDRRQSDRRASVAPNELDRALANAKARLESMTPGERKAMWEAQRDSWVRGEQGMNESADRAPEKGAKP